MISDEKIRSLLAKALLPPGTSLPAGAPVAALEDFETKSSVALPPSLRQWLGLCNGAPVGPGGLFGVDTADREQDMGYYWRIYPSWLARGWVPVAGDGCGNYYLVATRGEFGAGYPVFFVEATVDDDRPTFVVASDVRPFVFEFLSRDQGLQGWPFDRGLVLSRDPGIASFHDLPLPWEAA